MKSQLEQAAYHEAGHAVVANLSPTVPAVIQVRIGIGGGLGGGGVHYSLEEPPAVGLREKRLRVYQSQRMLFAGPLAEVIATGKAQGHEEDFAKIKRLLATDALLDCEGLNGPTWKASADRAFEAAIGRMRGAAAAAEFHVRAHWGAVEAVARALLQVGVISGEHLAHLIARAPQAPKFSELDDFASLAERATKFDPKLRASVIAACRAETLRLGGRVPVASGRVGVAVARRPVSRPVAALPRRVPRAGVRPAAILRPRFPARTVAAGGRDLGAVLAEKLNRAPACFA